MPNPSELAEVTYADLLRELAKGARAKAEKFRLDALLLSARADEQEAMRWDLELAADRWDDNEKRAQG